MVDCLVETVGSIRKSMRNYPTSEATLVSQVTKAIEKRKTYDMLMSLEKKNRIKRYLKFYTKYQFCTVSQLQEAIQKPQDQFILFELLVVVHLLKAAEGDRLFDFSKYFVTSNNSLVVEVPPPEIDDNDWIYDIVDKVRTDRRSLTNVEFAETLKVVAGPYKNRLFRFDRAPYQEQIHKWMSPEDPCRELVNMWSVQVGKSTVAENTVTYYMKVVPSEILAVLATEDAAKKFSKKRIEPRAESAGVKFIAESYGDTKKRASGNATLSKEFFGGNYDSVTAGSPSKLASETKRVLIKDEIDRWPESVGKEGDPDVVADARCDAWGSRAKILNVSSPNELHNSRIYKKYQKGTQHHYHIECPLCGDKYPMEFGVGENSGWTYETQAGVIDPRYIYYNCPKCKDAWFHDDKLMAMQKGLWVPHATSLVPNYISTQLSALYSPLKDWIYIAIQHKDMIDDPSKEKEFVNMTMGLPYEPKGSRPDADKLITLRDTTYKSKEVPEGVLYLTASCDVQRGSKGEKRKMNPPRLEIEILGHCDKYITKSVEYIVIHGETDVLHEGAWKLLDEMFDEGRFKYFRRRDQFEFQPMMWFFDARDGMRRDVVYEHCLYWGGANSRVYPIMGDSYIMRDGKDEFKEGHEDKAKNNDYMRYRRKKVNDDLHVYQISTNHYKNAIYRNVQKTIDRAGDAEEFPGRCYFPGDYSDNYFKMLTAEERRQDGTFYCPSGRRNETLDLRVYNLCAADVWMNMRLENIKQSAKAQRVKGWEQINYSYIRERLHKETAQIGYE